MHAFFRSALFLALFGGSAVADSFESAPVGSFTRLPTSLGEWQAPENQAAVLPDKGRHGGKSLRLRGAGEVHAILTLSQPAAAGTGLSFYAERWTARGPFHFRVDAWRDNQWQEIHRGDDSVKVGGYHARIDLDLPAGLSRLRFRCEAPAAGGVLLDDFALSRPGPAVVTGIETRQPVCPAFIRETFNPILGFRVTVEGRDGGATLDAMEILLTGTTRLEDIEELRIVRGTADPAERGDQVIASTRAISERLVLASKEPLTAGEHWLWVSPVLKAQADIDGRVHAALRRVTSGGKTFDLERPAPGTPQRIGYAVRMPGDDGSKSYRIPGMVQTTKGTLVAVYDIRYRHAGDLPADIDVGVSRSTDGGKTWQKMIVAMDMGRDPKHGYDGVGDPAILVDPASGRLWIAALWSHGNRGWNGSGPGLSPSETGQLMLAHSDDDGLTWSKPINVTAQLKDPAWRLLFNGPGAGIALRDGKLVFAAQYRAADGKPWSTLIWSGDGGNNWTIGTGVKSDTTEAQVAQLADGSIMINCRDNRGGARTVATTRDLGKTWQLHPTDRRALQEPVCMASLLALDHPQHGRMLAFSNPDTRSGRHSMTIKLSTDEGMTWPDDRKRLYDSRNCFGYSCLAPVGTKHLGVLYEGRSTMYFLRVPRS